MNPDQNGKIFIGKGSKREFQTLALANRHGLVAGGSVGRAIMRGTLGGILR